MNKLNWWNVIATGVIKQKDNIQLEGGTETVDLTNLFCRIWQVQEIQYLLFTPIPDIPSPSHNSSPWHNEGGARVHPITNVTFPRSRNSGVDVFSMPVPM